MSKLELFLKNILPFKDKKSSLLYLPLFPRIIISFAIFIMYPFIFSFVWYKHGPIHAFFLILLPIICFLVLIEVLAKFTKSKNSKEQKI